MSDAAGDVVADDQEWYVLHGGILSVEHHSMDWKSDYRVNAFNDCIRGDRMTALGSAKARSRKTIRFAFVDNTIKIISIY